MICVPLDASINGDRETAKIIIGNHPEVVRCSISENCDTALHIAASTKTTYLVERYVKNLVMLMTREDLELQNKSGNTALCLAAVTGNIKSAMAMVNKNWDLLDIACSCKMLPLYLASLFGQSEMVHYLYNFKGMTTEAWTNQYRGWVLEKCVDANIFVSSVISADVGPAEKPNTSDDDPTKYLSKLLFLAVEKVNTEFVVEIIRQYPDLIWKTDDNNQSIFLAAVSHRQVAAMRAKKTRLEDVSGVALQMQRELLWFMEVEAMMPLIFREKKNMDGLLLSDYLFTMEHADLLSARPIYMVVSALIATIAFAASFTIPGGYDQNSGSPIFLRKQSLKIFVISDSLSLTFSTISILIFLSILTSRYAEHDFLESLPKRLMRGLATLFLSIIAMMVTFSVVENDITDKKSSEGKGLESKVGDVMGKKQQKIAQTKRTTTVKSNNNYRVILVFYIFQPKTGLQISFVALHMSRASRSEAQQSVEFTWQLEGNYSISSLAQNTSPDDMHC
ncbi:ankyrin repeat-containing protein [Tanacetum coccineum]